MRWINRIKRFFLMKVLSALGFGGVIGLCIVSCDSKPASQEDRKINMVEMGDNTGASPSIPQESRTAENSANAENAINAGTEQEPSNTEIPNHDSNQASDAYDK